MRKIVLNLAVSIDGYIATEDGGYDWIKGDGSKHLDTVNAFNFKEFLNTIDTIIMGEKAYLDTDTALFNDKEIIVASYNFTGTKGNVSFIRGNLYKYLQKLRTEGDKRNIWLFGGGIMIDPLIKADIIDEYIIGIIPTILGKGRPLFLGNNPEIKLKLEEYSFTEGIGILRYSKRS